jgi:hypothetical protein
VGLGPGVDGVDIVEHGHGKEGEHLSCSKQEKRRLDYTVLRQNIHRVAFAMLLVASSQVSAQSGSFKCSCSVSLLNDGATHTEMDTVIVACHGFLMCGEN